MFSLSLNHDGHPVRPSKQFMTLALYIYVSGRPRKGECSDLTNAQKCFDAKKLNKKSSDF